MKINDDYNAIKIIEDKFHHQIRSSIAKEIERKLVKEFKESIHDEIVAAVEKVSFAGIKGMRDMMRLRDEFMVYLKIEGMEEKAIKGDK